MKVDLAGILHAVLRKTQGDDASLGILAGCDSERDIETAIPVYY